LLRRRARTHSIVEGALLGDIAIVFLLMRVYLPVPVVRTLLRTMAAVPFVMLAQRRGIRTGILAAAASYILFSALVGPILALPAIDVAVSGILVAIGRKIGLNALVNTLWTGVAYAILDLVIPTIVSVFIFRYPVGKLIDSAKHFVRLLFNLTTWVMQNTGAPSSLVRTVRGWEGPAVTHWQLIWVGSLIMVGLLNMYLVVLGCDMVLKQNPEETLTRQKAA